MKIGIIGLGDIATKAYLPVISKIENLEIHLCTRNQQRLQTIGNQYRFHHLHQTIDSLIASGIQGAFVHTSTDSHEEIVRELLQHDIHVFVDKPLTYNMESSESLLTLAESRGLMLMVGFNRRYAPSYQRLKEITEPNMVIIQKNRKSTPGNIRSFIFDDFIHVVDSLLYLFPHSVDTWNITGLKKEGLLYQVTVQGTSKEGAAIGIMNRDSGTTEEKAEVMSPTEKGIVLNVADVFIRRDKSELKAGVNDWEATLYKRGFEPMIDHFLETIEKEDAAQFLKLRKQILQTQEICEEIVGKLEKMN